AMQMTAMQKSMLPSGTTLRSLLDEEQTAAYEAALGGLGLPAPAFDRFEPWMAGLTLTMLPLLQQGYSPDSGVEKVLLTKAGDKPQDALETAEFQLNIFDSLPQDKQIAFLMEAVEGIDKAKETLDKMVAEWVEGDADGLAELMNEGLEDPAIAEALLYDRNANWAEWIDARLDTTPGTVFIAVGAGHLAGKKSVQDLLAERDIEVERLQ
ncbi:MAG: TraB/GumN family protein, partial [Pseudomonadota bacterium]